MTESTSSAGGRATSAGMDFQAGVGVWFAAHLITDTPVGGRFGLSRNALPTELRFETGRYLDDIEIRLSDGGAIFVQCKTSANLSAAADSALAATIRQLVNLFLSAKSGAATTTDLARSAAVLAVSQAAPRSLDDLEHACRYFDLGGTWGDTGAKLNQEEQSAIRLFEAHAQQAWDAAANGPLTGPLLGELARLFHVTRFEVDRGGADWREASRIVGARLFGREDGWDAPVTGLLAAVRRLITNGAPTDRMGLTRALRAEGFSDTRSPRFERDIKRLHAVTTNELQRLSRHTRLPIAGGLPIPRECIAALRVAIGGGSLLVTGEPGAGKTGVLVCLVEERVALGQPTVFISVDRFAGVSTAADLRSELRLDHHLLDVLEGWPGTQPGLLVIDALDASRGGPAESVFASLVEDALALVGERWSVVASIRSFDLRNGRRYRTIMAGAPPDRNFAEKAGLDAVRHFCVPSLSPGELRTLAQAHPELGRLTETAPPSVRDLLRNVFNLSLAADLVDHGVTADSIRTVTTQSELIERYENERLPNARLRGALTKVLAVMVDRKRLTVPQFTVMHDALDELMNRGVIAEAGDRVAFSHHILFDHAAGRFYLDWDDTDRLVAQITGDPAIGFLLGPALRFAMERVWRDDVRERSRAWRAIAGITSATQVDPIVSSVALRGAAESVAVPEDTQGLRDLIRSSGDATAFHSTLSWLARFVGMAISGMTPLPVAVAVAWTLVAQEAVETGKRAFADAARVLLWSIFEKGDFSDQTLLAAFGQAARSLLSLIWSDSAMQGLAPSAIRFVTRTYASNPGAGRTLLQQILEEPRFSLHVHEEGVSLAEGVLDVARSDPEFAAEIYAALFGRPAPQDRKTWVGGRPSRILPLTSNAKQDYEHARWRLRKSLPTFLKIAPKLGTRAVSRAVIGAAGEAYPNVANASHRIDFGSQTLTVIDDDPYPQEWRKGGRARHLDSEEEILSAYADFLSGCAPEVFRAAVETAVSEESSSSVLARLLGVAAERGDIADDLLWPIASSPRFLQVSGSSRDAIIYLSAAYVRRSSEERVEFESGLLARIEIGDDTSNRLRSLAARFLSITPEEALATAKFRDLRAKLGGSGKLTGNRPFLSIESGWGPSGDMTDRLLEDSGAALDQGPDKELRDSTRPLDDMLRTPGDSPDAAQLAALWTLSTRVVATVDRLIDPQPHSETAHASWGSVSNCVEKIAQAEAYTPGLEGQPTVSALLVVLDRLASSPYPEPRESSESGLMGWGNWDVRVYAASGLMALARRFGANERGVLDRLPPLLRDPAPTVRLQIAQSLNALWEVARAEMWQMVEIVGAEETDTGVLGFFVAGPLARLSGPAPDRVEAILASILRRIPRDDPAAESGRRNTFEEAVGGIAAQLWVGRGRRAAEDWIASWIADPVAWKGYLWSLVSVLRSALFEAYGATKSSDAGPIQERARIVIHQIVTAAAELLSVATQTQRSAPESERKRAELLYQVGDQLLDHASNQLYFGSGAFKDSNDKPGYGLSTPEAMRAFLEDYQPTLDVIGRAGTARTIHHMVELYEHVSAAAPAHVFDRVAGLLVGPAAREGYHFESLGSDALVRLVRHYLADYRAVFDDQVRRTALVRVLDLFSSAGWPEALKLMYELPDLLR